jgi:hypothetical protein
MKTIMESNTFINSPKKSYPCENTFKEISVTKKHNKK